MRARNVERGGALRTAALGGGVGAAAAGLIWIGAMDGLEVLHASSHNQWVVACADAQLKPKTQEVKIIEPACGEFQGNFVMLDNGSYVLPSKEQFIKDASVDVSDRLALGGLSLVVCTVSGAVLPTILRRTAGL